MGWVATHIGFPAAVGGGALIMLLIWLWARPKKEATRLVLQTQKQTGPNNNPPV